MSDNRIKSAISSLSSKIKETVTQENISQNVRDFIAGGSGLRNSQFIQDIYSGGEITPHEEMRGAEKLRRLDPLIVSSVQLFTDAIIGRELKVETEDGKGKAFFQSNILPKLKGPLREAIENMVVTGNGYLEVIRSKGHNETPLNFEPIARSEKVYIDYEDAFRPNYYVLQMPKMMKQDHYEVKYKGGYTRSIRGVKFEKDEIIHLKYGSSHIPVYGRSGLCSAIDSGKILRELERDMAVIARYKAIPKKLISVNNKDGTALSQEERNKIKKSFQKLEDFENPMISGREIETHEMEYNQNFGMENVVDYLKKKVTSTLAPGFYIHGEVTNYAVAQEQKNAYYLRVQALRDQIKPAINKILKEIAKKRGYKSDISIKFGEFDFPTKDEKIRQTIDKFKAGVITLDEARDELGLDKDEEIGDAYQFELSQQNPIQGAVQQALKSSEEETKEESKTEKS